MITKKGAFGKAPFYVLKILHQQFTQFSQFYAGIFATVLINDEVNIQLIIKKYAEFEKHEIREAEDGMKAVSMCKAEDFDVIILDVMMPELDGFELGIDDYVVKPFSPKELIEHIASQLKKQRAILRLRISRL